MKTFFGKSLFVVAACGLFFGMNASNVLASAASAPTITIKKQSDTSVTLRVLSEELKSKAVKVKVKIKDNDTGKSKTQTIDSTLDKKGVANVTVSDLKAEESYTFQATIRKASESGASGYSLPVMVNDIGAVFVTPSVDVDDVSKTSVKLAVSIPEWKKKKVVLKVLVDNTDDDKAEVQTFKKTLDSKGNVTLTIIGLSSDTEYAFNVAARFSSGSKGYSRYSSDATQKTDD